MKHPRDEELIELYYGEAPRAVLPHLEACPECAQRYSELKQALAAIDAAQDPQPAAPQAERVWQRLQPQLIPYGKTAWGFEWSAWRAVALAMSAVLLLALAFLGGRYWERHATGRADTAASAGAQATRRLVRVLLTDHLDRTERLLVELEHADPADPAANARLRSEAQLLLPSNRLYCATASAAGDQMLAGALDRLNGVLAEVANDPELTAGDLQRMRQGMNTQAILFEIRVLKARSLDHAKVQSHSRSRSI
jgi:hypothetical protein